MTDATFPVVSAATHTETGLPGVLSVTAAGAARHLCFEAEGGFLGIEWCVAAADVRAALAELAAGAPKWHSQNLFAERTDSGVSFAAPQAGLFGAVTVEAEWLLWAVGLAED